MSHPAANVRNYQAVHVNIHMHRLRLCDGQDECLEGVGCQERTRPVTEAIVHPRGPAGPA